MIPWILIRERGKQESQRRRCDDRSRGQIDVTGLFEDGRGLPAKEHGQPLEDGKGK